MIGTYFWFFRSVFSVMAVFYGDDYRAECEKDEKTGQKEKEISRRGRFPFFFLRFNAFLPV
ncbi:hypothetical protein [Laceyella putida]|uniref:YqzL family protein n=1 Tax=Laceyella putida TaxID=110101 RepID=A0ABW2RHR4_9BACL